jgi:AmmeMemoRadiSam system protein B
MTRLPAVAGTFYDDDPHRLKQQLAELIPSGLERQAAIGVVSPHAGYVYSGRVAGELLARVELPATVIILGPNHHGRGAQAALSPDDDWLTPLGTVPVDRELALLIQRHSPLVVEDREAHRYEHSLEVQLPFLQYLRADIRIVPLCLCFGDLESCQRLGNSLAAAITDYGKEVLILASSDMTHYESALAARQKDEQALNRLLALDAAGLHRVCREERITMCGVIPAVTMLFAAKELGAQKAQLIRYATSGEVTGDESSVVAYAAVTLS